MVSFALNKSLSFIRSYLYIFAFISITWRWIQKTYCYNLCVMFLPVFSSRRYIVFEITLRSLNHFEITFVYVVRECSHSILLSSLLNISEHWVFCEICDELHYLTCLRTWSFLFFFWIHLWHAEVPRLGREPVPQQQPEPPQVDPWGSLSPCATKESPFIIFLNQHLLILFTIVALYI